mgnify:CR=1 FL=1|jgi:hypothetical protein
MPIVVNLTKAKVVAHDIRRVKRAEEFVPHDEVIMKQIPGADTDAAETARQAIRTKYATAQTNIDSAADVSALTTLVNDL